MENLARDAYTKRNYAIPVSTSAIAYSKRALALDPSSNYSKTLLENSVAGGKYQAQQALKHRDFAAAHRVANAMTQLLPGRRDIAELKKDISITEKGSTAPRRRQPPATLSFAAYHLHSGKTPADHGPYCLGIWSITGQHLKFTGRSASEGQKVHTLDFACADVREIKKNSHVASHQGGFHLRTDSGNTNFVPQDSSLTHISALASACSE